MTDTTEHAWAMEHIAAYIAAGLDAQEAERLEAHARECAACAAAIGTAGRLDGGVSTLFADARPAFGLEDRAIRKWRTTPRRPLMAGWVKRAMTAAAAVIILGTIGAAAGSVLENGLPIPGFAARSSKVPITPPARDGFPPAEDLTNEDGGLQSKIESSLPGIERVDKQTVNSAVTMDGIGQPNSPDTDKLGLAVFGNGSVDGIRGHGLMANMYGSIPSWQVIDNTNTVWNEMGGTATGSFPGRSGATKSRLMNEGGGNDTPQLPSGQLNSLGYYPPSRALVIRGTERYHPAASAKLFRPEEYKPEPPKSITATERVPVQKTVTVLEKPPAPKAPEPKVVNPTQNAADSILMPIAQPPAVKADPEPARRVILRNGEIEFEVESLDAGQATVAKLVSGIKGAFVSTTNDEKLTNGKTKRSITVRVLPEAFDSLVLEIRKELGKGGTLKGMRIGSQDVTKQYIDLESRLKVARTMEQRLLQIIKEGKGEIKLLLEAEKQLGEWRTKIEEMEGEIRYYANMAALSTLTVTLIEKDVFTERERVQTGIEVEDVDKAYQQVLAAVAEMKGRVTKSEVKQVSAGQFNAAINFEMAPDSAGPMRDRLKQLGRIARLEIDRLTQAEGGTTPTDVNIKAKRGDTVFQVQLYNVANIAAREIDTLQVAVVDVPTAYQSLRDTLAKTNSRVLVAQLNEQDRQNITALLDFEVRRADEAAVKAALDAAGEVVARQVTRAAESENVTDAKVFYKTTIMAAAKLKPREITTITVEVPHVSQAAKAFAAEVADAKGRQIEGQTTREQNGRMTAKLTFEVPLTAATGLVEQFKAAGVVRSQHATRDPNASDGKFATARIEVTLASPEDIVAADDGVWHQVRRGLSYSASMLLKSVTLVVIGLCVVVPWAVIGFAGYRVTRRLIRGHAETTSPPPA